MPVSYIISLFSYRLHVDLQPHRDITTDVSEGADLEPADCLSSVDDMLC